MATSGSCYLSQSPQNLQYTNYRLPQGRLSAWRCTLLYSLTSLDTAPLYQCSLATTSSSLHSLWPRGSNTAPAQSLSTAWVPTWSNCLLILILACLKSNFIPFLDTYYDIYYIRAGEMDQLWKPEGLCYNPRTHVKVKENQLNKVVWQINTHTMVLTPPQL